MRPLVNYYAVRIGGWVDLREGKKKASRNRRRVRQAQREEEHQTRETYALGGRIVKHARYNNTVAPLRPLGPNKAELRREAEQAYKEWQERQAAARND